VLAACADNAPTIFHPASPEAHDIARLAIEIFVILSGVLLTVWIWLGIDVVRFRNRPEEEASQTRGNLKIELVWTAIPLAIVSVLFAMTLHTTGQLVGMSSADPTQLTVDGRQWWWDVQYRGATFHTANEIHVPVDQIVHINLLSSDVIHSFWVPQMGGKVQMIPTHVNATTFLPTKTGTYLGQCAEFCGTAHPKMRFLFVVETSAQFGAWFDDQQKPARQPVGARAIAGSREIAALPCSGCHAIRGTSLEGAFGPDLTHFGSRQGIAAYTLTNTPANLARWIDDPQGIKPGAHMPAVPLPPQEIADLVAYLEELK
jgi:cytochrome c oxidase subunit 2